MNVEEALKLISLHLYNTSRELSDGSDLEDPKYGYDHQLIIEIGQAVSRWKDRQTSKIEDPYLVWVCRDGKFMKASPEMYQEDAYREWYRLTNGGKQHHNSGFELYYVLEKANWDPNSCDEPTVEIEDGFSSNYLLNKSFGT